MHMLTQKFSKTTQHTLRQTGQFGRFSIVAMQRMPLLVIQMRQIDAFGWLKIAPPSAFSEQKVGLVEGQKISNVG